MKNKFSLAIAIVLLSFLPLHGFSQLTGDFTGAGDMMFAALSNTNGELFNTPSSDYMKDADQDGVKDKDDVCPDTPTGVAVSEDGCPIDGDKDLVADYLDKCPMVVGFPKLNGCPDKDKDDVADIDDSCPDVPGLTRFSGCPDSDNDGIEDAADRCPNLKGLDMFKGCPDSDGDGIDDSNDKCPDTKTGIKVDGEGCVADIDRDGIIDSEDKCPDTPKGIKVDTRGCPADTDGDGILDTNDKCPTTKGEGTTNGCPVVKPDVKKRLNFAARGINFESGKATLTSSSYPMLDEVKSILAEYTDYNLSINGYTDNVGGDDMNLQLSKDRVEAVKAYLFSKGVSDSRLVANGFGEANPVGDNNTAAGRTQNRRVELDLFIK